MNYVVATADQKVSYELLGELMKNNVLFGIKTRNKNFSKLHHCVRLKYSFLSAELYLNQMNSLAEYMKKFYDEGLNEDLLVVDRKRHYTGMLSVFSRIANLNFRSGKLIAGCMTNAQPKSHITPSGVFILHDKKQSQIVSECIKTKTPVIGFNNLVTECRVFTRIVIINNFHHLSISYSLWFLLKKLEELGCIDSVMSYQNFLVCCESG